MAPLDLGSYEKRIDGDGRALVTGLCAGCGDVVTANQPSVVRYHPTIRGGIFHARCAPDAALGWYAVEEEVEPTAQAEATRDPDDDPESYDWYYDPDHGTT